MSASRFVVHVVAAATITLWGMLAVVGFLSPRRAWALDPLTGQPSALQPSALLSELTEAALSPVSWLLLTIFIALALGAEARRSRMPVDNRFVTAIGVALGIGVVALFVVMVIAPFLPGFCNSMDC